MYKCMYVYMSVYMYVIYVCYMYVGGCVMSIYAVLFCKKYNIIEIELDCETHHFLGVPPFWSIFHYLERIFLENSDFPSPSRGWPVTS